MEKHPILVLITGIFGISMSGIIVRFSNAPSAVTALYRLVWTVILMTPSRLLNKENRNEFKKIAKKDYMLSALSGLFLAVHFTTWFESLKLTSVASSTIIVCTEVIWVALGYCLFMHGSIKKKEVLAIAISFVGSVLIAMSDIESGSNNIKGDLLSLAAAVAVGVYTLLGREVRERMSTGAYTYVCYVSCGTCLLLFSLVKGTPLFGYGKESIFCGLLLAIFPTILGHSIFSWCLKYFSPAFVSACKLCEPVISSAIAAVLFKELPTALMLVGGVIVLAGVLYFTYCQNITEGIKEE